MSCTWQLRIYTEQRQTFMQIHHYMKIGTEIAFTLIKYQKWGDKNFWLHYCNFFVHNRWHNIWSLPVFEHKEILMNIEKTRTRLLYEIVYVNIYVKSNNSNKPKMFYALHAEQYDPDVFNRSPHMHAHVRQIKVQ